jgi:cell division septation protein DedD
VPATAPTPARQPAPVALRRDAPAESPVRATGGRYRLQVAAVRSEAEAQALAARMRERHGSEIASLRTEIDQTVVGNMGTLYRVRLGPFADANEPRALCARLKGDGLDCLIVTQ